MAHELFNFGVAGRRDFAGRGQLQPNAAGSAGTSYMTIPLKLILKSDFPANPLQIHAAPQGINKQRIIDFVVKYDSLCNVERRKFTTGEVSER